MPLAEHNFLNFIVSHLSTPVLLVDTFLYPSYASVHHRPLLCIVHLFWSSLCFLFEMMMMIIITGFCVLSET